MKTAELLMTALVICQLLWHEPCHSAEGGDPGFKEEITKQEGIFSSEGDQVPGGYTINRTLSNYGQALCSGFDGDLANLGPNDRWLDVGAGQGLAILDYFTPEYDLAHIDGWLKRGKKARVVAMSIEDRRTPVWDKTAASLAPNQLQYLISKRLREYSSSELGKFQVITDVIGGFSYADNLSQFMEKVLEFLDVNGSFYSVLQDVHTQEGTNQPFYKDAPYLTEITKADGSEVKVCSWLKSIKCVEVSCEAKSGWKPPLEAFHVRKICNDVSVPALAPVHFKSGTPPERRYRLRD